MEDFSLTFDEGGIYGLFTYEADPELTPGKEEKKRKPRTLRKELFKGLQVEEEVIDLPECRQPSGTDSKDIYPGHRKT